MFKNSVVFVFFIFVTTSNLFAQHFMKGIGANISILTAKINTPSEKYTFMMSVVHLSFFPRYNLTESENSSVSVGSPFGVGIGILTEAGNASGIAWGVDVPLVIDYNIGLKSTPDNENSSGGYFGGGFGFMYTGWSGGGNSLTKAITYGPLARAGFRFSSSEGKWNTTVGIYFKMGIEKEKFKTFGFNVYKEL